MYPGTIFNWYDNSSIDVSPTSNVEDGTPLFMQVFSADKGTEDYIEIAGEDFDKMYGTMSFERHGQSAIQAKNIIDHGGRLYAKRVVAPNSTLANAILVADVSVVQIRIPLIDPETGEQKQDEKTKELLWEAEIVGVTKTVPTIDSETLDQATDDEGNPLYHKEPVMVQKIEMTPVKVVPTDTHSADLIDPETGEVVMTPVLDENGNVIPVTEEDPETHEQVPVMEQATKKVYKLQDKDGYVKVKWRIEYAETETIESVEKPTYHPDGTPVIDPETGTPVTKIVKVKVKKGNTAKTFDDVLTYAKTLYHDTDKSGVASYPLFVYSDNGRGVSKKAVAFSPDYTTSKTIGKTFYTLNVHEDTVITEKRAVTFDPDVIYGNVAYRLDKTSGVQIIGEVPEDIYALYLADINSKMINTATGKPYGENVLRNYDIVYGYTNRGDNIPEFELDTDSVDLDADNGIMLGLGDNGDFGEKNDPATRVVIDPVPDPETGEKILDPWTAAVLEAFSDTNGEHDEIYDVDAHMIAAIVDANYPIPVKSAIFDFVTFRKDCVYFRDFNLGNTTYLSIKAKYDSFVEERNYFVGDYCTDYNILDPVTKKVINVTMLYDMAGCLIDHIRNNANAPVAGVINGFILENAIKGSVSYTPVITPSDNYKEAIDAIRVNYAIFQDDQCVVQSCYTSQLPYTQLSFIGNVIAIQEVLRAVRTACPKNRFSLSTGNDLSNYAAAVNSVLSNYVGNFSVLNFIYQQDDLKARQKIFYASIEFAFLNWAQTEIFDIYAING